MRHPKELTRTTEKEDLACCIHGLFLSSNHLPQKLVAWSKSCTQLGQYCWFMCSTKAVQGVEFLFEALTGMGFKNYAPPIGWLSRGRPKSNWNKPCAYRVLCRENFWLVPSTATGTRRPIHLCAELRKHTQKSRVHNPWAA
jgi:hypothetical protein